MYCYLLHGFVVLLLLRETNLFPTLRHGSIGRSHHPCGAVILALLLMTPAVVMLFRPLFESKLDWAFRPRESLPR